MGRLMLAAAIVILSVSPALAQGFTDPVAYCRNIGTIDQPDARYTGPKLPAWMAAKLHMTPDESKLMEWRCADGAVLACQYGANIPCDAKANTSRTPTPAIAQFCHENPTCGLRADGGHRTRDRGVVGLPHRQPLVTQVGEVDAQGYAKLFWHRVAP